MNPTNIHIETASVKVMRSFDYCHFEVSLSSTDVVTIEDIDKLRKTAARLADKAVEQYIVAKTAIARREQFASDEYALRRAKETAEADRTPQDKAIIKFHEDAAFASQFDYDYEDDWDEPEA